MILVLSDRNDLATYRVVKNLEYQGNEVIIITDEDIVTDINISEQDIKLRTEIAEIRFSEIKAYWYRRGNFNLKQTETVNVSPEMQKDMSNERSMTQELLHVALLRKPHLGSIFNADLNRMAVLWRARECGLETPGMGLFNTKSDLCKFQEKHNKIIVKPLGNGANFIRNNKLFVTYTSIFSKQDIRLLPEYFPASLFMEYVEKKYEVRVFYIDGECYSLATFSQGDPLTEIDYRRYNKQDPNRNAYYELPEAVQVKIRSLMNVLNLNTGSVDIIVTPDDRFVFLEVNPVGQFLNIEELTNQNLSARIAEYLTKISTS